jgi:molybdopterin converting factor small subunit
MTPVQVQKEIQVKVFFYSYFKDLVGCAHVSETVTEGITLGELFERILSRFPRLEAMRKATLIAVGVDYQDRDYLLKAGDEVSLFPPVQGG